MIFYKYKRSPVSANNVSLYTIFVICTILQNYCMCVYFVNRPVIQCCTSYSEWSNYQSDTNLFWFRQRPYVQCRKPVRVDSSRAYNGRVANRKNVKCLRCHWASSPPFIARHVLIVHVLIMGEVQIERMSSVRCHWASSPPFIAWHGDSYLLSWSLLWDRVTLQLDHLVKSPKLDVGWWKSLSYATSCSVGTIDDIICWHVARLVTCR
jgi:hypothetical protein